MDEDFFLKKMKGVKVYKKDKPLIKNKTISKKTSNTNTITKAKNLQKPVNQKINNKMELDLFFGEVNKDLKRGKVKIDRKLDLHGYSLMDAHQKFKNEVEKNYNKGKRCILVITGKGIHKKIDNEQDTNPKLFYGKIKNSIIDWIKEDDLKKYILTYQDAGFEHGGDGALFVYLRKKKF